MEQGIEQGIEQGKAESIREMARKLLDAGASDEMMRTVTGLSAEEISRLRQS